MEKIRYRLVYNRKNCLNSAGKALIQVEALLSGQKVYFTTNIYITPQQWCKNKIVNHPLENELNTMLYEFILKLESVEVGLWKKGITPTLTRLKESMKSNSSPNISFSNFCKNCIIQSTRSTNTKRNLFSTINALSKFKNGYSWDDLTYSFIKEFDLWLKNRGCSTNTAGKHLKNLKALVNEAIAGEYIPMDKNPFRNYKIAYEKRPHRFLSFEELNKIETLNLKGKIAHVRDAFLFCCYTGLRFSDFISLHDEYISIQDDITWLKIKTKKTKTVVNIPISLLFDGKALHIMAKYSSLKRFSHIGSNSNTNTFLQKIQQKLMIDTKMTFHVARHTCATLLCNQSIPITTIQKILGHSKVTTTQIYSEVIEDTIIKDLMNAKSGTK